MNFRHNIKCNVCNEFLIVKAQGGFVENAHVRLGCPHCRNLIKGEINQKAPAFSMKFENAELVNEIPTDDVEVISISTELPVLKALTNMRNVGGITLSPFSAVSQIIPLEQVALFRDRYLDFKAFRDKNLSKLETIVELFSNKQWSFVFSEIKKNFLPELTDDSPKTMEFCSHILSEVLKQFVNKTIPQNYEHSYPIRLLHKTTLTKVQHNEVNLSQIHKDVSQLVDIEKEYSNGLRLVISFIKNVESYLPAIALSYGKGFEASFGNDIAITTFSFDELRDKYKDAFELLARTSLIYVGFSNFNRKGASNDFSDIGVCNNLTSYYSTNNGNKKNVLDKIPKLKSYYRSLMDSQIRNSIGHNKTEYLTVEQLIKYYPYTDIQKKDRAKEISLIDFAYKTFLLNLLVMDFISFIGKWNYRLK